jgi:hypothetical protein
MGKLHARVYSQMPGVRLVGVYDADPDAAEAAVAEFGGEVFRDAEALAERVQAVTVAVPTNFHASVAEPVPSPPRRVSDREADAKDVTRRPADGRSLATPAPGRCSKEGTYRAI